MQSTPELLPWIITIAAAVISFAAGIFCLIRFVKTRKPLFLGLGLLLTFLVPGVLLYLGTQYLSTQYSSTPWVSPPEPGMVYGPQPYPDAH
jgi:hypothetical protein